MKHAEGGGGGENEINTKEDEASKETVKKLQDITNRGEEDRDKPENTVKEEEKCEYRKKEETAKLWNEEKTNHKTQIREGFTNSPRQINIRGGYKSKEGKEGKSGLWWSR